MDRKNVKVRLNLIYNDSESQYNFLVHATLYSRLKLRTLSELLQIDENELVRC